MVLPVNAPSLTIEQARSLVDYDPNTGVFIWKLRSREWFADERKWKKFNTQYAGKEAGSPASNGYKRMTIKYVEIAAHRLAWAVHYGEWPTLEIDHINNNRADNRICNLRQGTPEENSRNKKLSTSNKSGFKGVSLDSRLGMWRAGIQKNGKCHFLGNFETAEDAAEAYHAAADSFHGIFAKTAIGTASASLPKKWRPSLGERVTFRNVNPGNDDVSYNGVVSDVYRGDSGWWVLITTDNGVQYRTRIGLIEVPIEVLRDVA